MTNGRPRYARHASVHQFERCITFEAVVQGKGRPSQRRVRINVIGVGVDLRCGRTFDLGKAPRSHVGVPLCIGNGLRACLRCTDQHARKHPLLHACASFC